MTQVTLGADVEVRDARRRRAPADRCGDGIGDGDPSPRQGRAEHQPSGPWRPVRDRARRDAERPLHARRRSWWSSWPSSAARSRRSAFPRAASSAARTLDGTFTRLPTDRLPPCPRRGRRRVHLLPDRGARDPVRGHARVRHGVRVPRHEPAGTGAHPVDPEGAHRVGRGDRRARTAACWPTSCRPRRTWRTPRASRPAAGAWSRTSGPTPARASSICISISWVAARWPGLPVEARPAQPLESWEGRSTNGSRSIQEGTGLSPERDVLGERHQPSEDPRSGSPADGGAPRPA